MRAFTLNATSIFSISKNTIVVFLLFIMFGCEPYREVQVKSNKGLSKTLG